VLKKVETKEDKRQTQEKRNDSLRWKKREK